MVGKLGLKLVKLVCERDNRFEKSIQQILLNTFSAPDSILSTGVLLSQSLPSGLSR